MIRKIVNIDKEKCNGCGLCVDACHEGAIRLVDGKAELISDEYCDGLGDCLPECSAGAIEIIERESAAYDEEMVLKKKNSESHEKMPCGCPGTAARVIKRRPAVPARQRVEKPVDSSKFQVSELQQWPVQLKLVNSKAPYLKGANLLVAADCTAYAYAGFHRDFIKGRITLIGCPKLDDVAYYEEKLTEILKVNSPKSITVVRMEVPCCKGIVAAVKSAMLKSGTIVPYNEAVVTTDGNIMN